MAGRLVPLLLILLALTACAPLREDAPAPVTRAFQAPMETRIGRAMASEQARHPGQSGFRLLNNGASALFTRAALAEAAQQSIDFQTFILDHDSVGAFVIDRLLAAARRGVRVRILLDDYELGLSDPLLARLDAEPNVEVRLFNPFPDRARWSRPLQMAWDMNRLGRRMHNKLFLVDGQSVLLGGRNISDHYFEGPSDVNFRDIELLGTGPVASQAGESFDAFWNSAMVRPAKALSLDGANGDSALTELLDLLNSDQGPRAAFGAARDDYAGRVLSPNGLIWAPARVVAEPPDRKPEGAEKASAEIARAHALIRQNVEKDVIYEAAYFIPGDKGVQVLGDLVARGVAVTVLTNSLAATDVTAVHGAYAIYRPALLERGVRLFEYRTDAKRPSSRLHRLRDGNSDSALHAKIVVYDRRILWVGSANFDARSRRLNTEIGVMVESPELSARVLTGIEMDFSPSRSWRLESNPGAETGPIAWVGERDGHMVRLPTEPDGDPWRGLKMILYGVLPGVEELL